MAISTSTVAKMRSAARPRLRWWQLSLRTLLALLTLAGVAAFFHEPIAAWGKTTWERWFAEPLPPAQPPPPVRTPMHCPGCGMG